MERIISLNTMKKVFTAFLVLICLILTGCGSTVSESIDINYFIDSHQSQTASGSSYVYNSDFSFLPNSEDFLYQNVCYTSENVISTDYDFSAISAACFDIDNGETLYAKDIFEKVYPASTTKLLTALVAAKYSEPEDIVTVAQDNAGITIKGAQLCGFKAGDSATMKDMLYCLLMYSGNDAAVAIAEHISGSVEAFCKLMNEEAVALGATGTHFTNPHGLHDPKHYTTAYDIYLIFSECLKYPSIKQIFRTVEYTSKIKSADGTVRDLTVMPTNLYAHGKYMEPDGIKVMGGKTGETIAAGNCLVLYCEDGNGNGYITELFKSTDRDTVYKEMNELLGLCVR